MIQDKNKKPKRYTKHVTKTPPPPNKERKIKGKKVVRVQMDQGEKRREDTSNRAKFYD